MTQDTKQTGNEKENTVSTSEKLVSENVQCSFCGNGTMCDQCTKNPAGMNSSEHMCYDCYQKMGGKIPENVRDKTHVCIPPEKVQENFENFLNQMTYRAFTDLWGAEKKKLKEMSRQDLAQTSFFEGARFMFDFMQRMSAENRAADQAAQEKNPEPKPEK